MGSRFAVPLAQPFSYTLRNSRKRLVLVMASQPLGETRKRGKKKKERAAEGKSFT